eukprot:3536556-Rhodomonas_salina.1
MEHVMSYTQSSGPYARSRISDARLSMIDNVGHPTERLTHWFEHLRHVIEDRNTRRSRIATRETELRAHPTL